MSIYKINIYDFENQIFVKSFNNYKVYESDQWAPVTSCFREDFDQKFEKLSRSIEFIEEFERKFIITSWIEDKLTWDSENRILTIL